MQNSSLQQSLQPVAGFTKIRDKTRESAMSAVPMMLTISQKQGKVDGGDGENVSECVDAGSASVLSPVQA